MSLKSFFLCFVLIVSGLISCNKDGLNTTSSTTTTITPDTVITHCDSFRISIKDSILSVDKISLRVQPTYGTQPFRYQWSNGDTIKAISITENGKYDVTVVDANGCKSITSTSIGVLTPLCRNFTTQINTQYNSTGYANLRAEPTGGTPPYLYKWSNGAINNPVTVNTSGNYSVTVSDAKGCVAINSTITTVSLPCETLNVDASIALNQNIIIRAYADGGTLPYNYKWSTGATTDTLIVTNSGKYTVTLTDNKGCTTAKEIHVLKSDTCGIIWFTFNWDKNNKKLSVVMPATYRQGYLWSTGATSISITAEVGNIYEVTVTDSRGCLIKGKIQL